MKGIHTLIRLSKRALDDLRKKQASLETQKEKLLDAIRKLDRELHNEMLLLQKAPEMGSFYGDFAKRIRSRQDTLREEIKKVEEELVQLSNEIMDAFADLKKYEIVRDNAKARAKAEEARKETIAMDEIASTQFARKDRQS